MISEHGLLDARDAARFLVCKPLVLAEREPEMFAMIRRHEDQLDRWFTQRFGYRLQVEADTARLFKTSVVARRRPLRATTGDGRPFSHREYVVLALLLSAVVAGPNVISLRDLILELRSAATDADVPFGEEHSDRRAFVTVVRWLIEQGAITELHDRVDRYASDDDADAVLQVRPDRVSILALPNLAAAASPDELLDRSSRREQTRQWMRAWLLEEPALYRTDLSDDEWAELRRRLGEEANLFDEMFGLEIEARAEGIAAIDPDGRLTDVRFPTSGTVGHAALLLIGRLDGAESDVVDRATLARHLTSLAGEYQTYWSALAKEPEKLLDQVIVVLADQRLLEPVREVGEGPADADQFRVLPAAWRYRANVTLMQTELFQ